MCTGVQNCFTGLCKAVDACIPLHGAILGCIEPRRAAAQVSTKGLNTAAQVCRELHEGVYRADTGQTQGGVQGRTVLAKESNMGLLYTAAQGCTGLFWAVQGHLETMLFLRTPSQMTTITQQVAHDTCLL